MCECWGVNVGMSVDESVGVSVSVWVCAVSDNARPPDDDVYTQG
jgi:hypothetical protein